MIYAIIIYVVVANLATFIVYGIDKRLAKSSHGRISERTLLLLAIAGGSIGAIAGMRTWRHKTQHAKFRYGLPAILAAQLAVVGAIIYWLYI